MGFARLHRFSRSPILIVFLLALCGCEQPSDPVSPAQVRSDTVDAPNIVWIVWDTCRRDRLSLYDSKQTTTPQLAAWARHARIYNNCLATASTTVPSHVSMFTGLLPAQHGAHNRRVRVPAETPTLAELLTSAGYQTYLFSANPYVAAKGGVARGFQTIEHPWDDTHSAAALALLRSKIDPEDRSCELVKRLNDTGKAPLAKAGGVSLDGVDAWLQQRDPDKPFLVFLNWMEAHRPFLPPPEARADFLTPAQQARSLVFDRTWPTMWSYTLGVHDYTDEDLALFTDLYDASLRELDGMFANLLKRLEQQGVLDNTVIVLTSDHGEHLGDHHRLDHQYSLYNSLLEIPLVVHHPDTFAPGVDTRPASHLDLFPTLLALAGVSVPDNVDCRGVDLRNLPTERDRLAAYPAWVPVGIRNVRESRPDFDARPWQRTFDAWFSDSHKLIVASDDRHELYNLAQDPGETNNLAEAQPERLAAMLAAQRAFVADLKAPSANGAAPQRGPRSKADLDRLRSLGYVHDEEVDDDTDD